MANTNKGQAITQLAQGERTAMLTGAGSGWPVVLLLAKHKVLYLTDSNNVDRSNELYFERTPHLNFRLRFADVKYNIGKNLGLCASFGWGTDGVLTFGVLYKFTGRK